MLRSQSKGPRLAGGNERRSDGADCITTLARTELMPAGSGEGDYHDQRDDDCCHDDLPTPSPPPPSSSPDSCALRAHAGGRDATRGQDKGQRRQGARRQLYHETTVDELTTRIPVITTIDIGALSFRHSHRHYDFYNLHHHVLCGAAYAASRAYHHLSPHLFPPAESRYSVDSAYGIVQNAWRVCACTPGSIDPDVGEADEAPGMHNFAAEAITDEAIRVEYSGTVGLLELRGGGRKGIEDLLMELGPHNTDVLDPSRACDGCRRPLNRADEIWALCVNGHFRCEACATSLQCPWCPSTSESDHRIHEHVAEGEPFLEFGIEVGHVQRAIHRIEHGHLAGSFRRAVPGGGKRGGMHDNGAGILRWLYESDDETDDLPLPEATDSSPALDASPGADRPVTDWTHQDETPAQAAIDRDASDSSHSNEGALHTSEWRVFDQFAPEFVQHGQWLDHHIGNPRPTESGVVIAPWATITGTYDHDNIRICRQCHLGRPASSSHWRPLRGGLVVCDVCFGSPATTTHGPPAPGRTTDTDSSGVSAWTMEGLPADQPLVSPPPSAPPQPPPDARLRLLRSRPLHMGI